MRKLFFILLIFMSLPVFIQAQIDTIPYVEGVTTHKDVRDKLNEAVGVLNQYDTTKAPLASPVFTGLPTLPSPFKLGADSVKASAIELNILDGALVNKDELNYLIGTTSNLQDQLDANAADIDTLETDTIDIANLALDLSSYAVMLADSIADSTGNYVTQTQFNTHKADTTAITGYATQSDINLSHFLKGTALMGGTMKATILANQVPTSNTALVDGYLTLSALYLPNDTTVTGVYYCVQTAGNFNQDNNNRIGLYKLTGTGALTLVASCANDSTLYDNAGYQYKAFSASYKALSGIYYIGYLYNRVTAIAAPSLATVTMIYGDHQDLFTNGNAFNVSNSAQTDLPNTIDITSDWTSETHTRWGALK